MTSADDPIYIDEVWLDTVVVVGLTCFILCLMGLSKVRYDGLAPYDLVFCASGTSGPLTRSMIQSICTGVYVQDGDDLRHHRYGCVDGSLLDR